jgi:CRISPR-associated protein Csc2
MPIIEIPKDLVPENSFLDQIPKAPTGHYAHLIVVRETESFSVFQTDGTLNIAKVSAGMQSDNSLIRLAMFKRKQSSPERLTGRELLRRANITQNEDNAGKDYCDYNEKFCTTCPDCVYYGFAIGDSGSEKSKVYVDTAYSITGYDESHQQFSFNALYEKGNMSQHGEVRSSFGEQDHIVPQVFFPSVITIKDVTVNSFAYVLNNLLRTKRYGAQTTRTGRISNHIVGAVFADGEIFSNLKFTQAIHDALGDDKNETPLNPAKVLQTGKSTTADLLKDDGVNYHLLDGENLQQLLGIVKSATTDEEKLYQFLQEANAETQGYSERVIQKASNKKKK